MEANKSTYLANKVECLWEKVIPLHDTWVAQAGPNWAEKVQEKTKANGSERVCVTCALCGVATDWREGDKGFYACSTCVDDKVPCFTYASKDEYGGRNGRLWCLPIHEVYRDSNFPVVKRKEQRKWINCDGNDSDDESEGEGGDTTEEEDSDNSDDTDNDVNEERKTRDSSEDEYGDDENRSASEEPEPNEVIRERGRRSTLKTLAQAPSGMSKAPRKQKRASTDPETTTLATTRNKLLRGGPRGRQSW
jgi:hypothetical protein